MSTTEAGLFDRSEFEVPFPEVDGHRVDKISLRVGGVIKLNRNDPEHAAMAESLVLGRRIQLRVFGSVAGKQDVLRVEKDSDGGESEVVTHAISVVIDAIETEDA